MKDCKCSICGDNFKSKQKLDVHYKQFHCIAKPYECSICRLKFTHNKDLQRHNSLKHNNELVLDEVWENFSTWLKNTKQIKNTDRIITECKQFNELYEIKLEYGDSNIVDMFEDCINTRICNGDRKNTVYKYLSHIYMYIEYICVIDEYTHTSLLAKLKSITGKLSCEASSQFQSETAVCILDPDKLVTVRNRFVSKLIEKQMEYNARIMDFLRNRTKRDHKDIITFGLELRCWIELCIRFTNIAHRTQASKELILPNSDISDFVCKLVSKNGMFYRIWYQDKVGNSKHQRPVECSLGITLSCYLKFYIGYCRVHDKSHYVYTDLNGSKWNRLARDIKLYCKSVLGIDTESIDPSGRFTHFIRHISLASYAYGCGFDLNKMQRFATLMRHSFSVMNKYYTTWTKWYTAQLSASEYFESMGLQNDQTIEHQNSNTYRTRRILQLNDVPKIISSILKDDELELYVSYQDKSTQTLNSQSKSLLIESLCDIHPLDLPPKCVKCTTHTTMHGPSGLSRSKNFARYFFKCSKCKLDDKYYLPEGYIPSNTDSVKPRNIEEIKKVHRCWDISLFQPVKRAKISTSLKSF